MIEQHFGRALTVGIEEELWILDRDGDLYAGVLTTRQSLGKALRRLE